MLNFYTAQRILASGEYTCLLRKNNCTYYSKQQGVKPLVAWLQSDVDFYDFSAADKVVGKGAAFLYILLGVRRVYASVISKPALKILQTYKINVEYDTLVESINNHKKDGICPFETAVMNVKDPDEAYQIILRKMDEMNISL